MLLSCKTADIKTCLTQQCFCTNDRVRDWSHATVGAVRSGAQHRSESVVAQSPTPRSPEGQGG